MGEQYKNISIWLAERWEGIIKVNYPDEEDTRLGRLFNSLLVLISVIAAVLSVSYLMMIPLQIGNLYTTLFTASITLFFIPFAIIFIIMTKRGYVRSIIRLYVWSGCFSINVFSWFVDGLTSPAWILNAIMISIAGSLLTPVYALWITGLVGLYFLLMLLLSFYGLYSPLINLEPSLAMYISMCNQVVVITFTIGLLTYFNMKSLRNTMARLRMKAKELEEHQLMLEQRVKERTEELMQANAILDRLATYDSLTDLPNRMMFSQLLNRTIQASRRYNRQFAVLFVDLDRFKIINDTLGHEAGDQLLQEIAIRFKQTLRSVDVVARLGGDEFIILVDEVNDLNQIVTVAHKILSAASKPMVLMDEECRVTASIGISIYPKDAEDEQSLIKTADTAMYSAKEEGKNNYQFYSKDIQSKSVERLSIDAHMRLALERNEFSLHYQARLDFKTNTITGVEALLRWQNPYLGSVTPTQFIPVAEETGLIVPIGRWVLKTACDQNVAWQRQGLPAVCMAVNLSFRQITDEFLLQDIETALKDSGMAPNLLELEITESILMHNPAYVTATLIEIKKMGVRIAIDDFGTATLLSL